MFFDPQYLLLVGLPTLILSLLAQLFVRSAYSKWSNVRNSAGVTGINVAERIFARTHVNPVRLEGAPGQLSDHFDPGAGVVRLSQGIATVPSVASMAVVAHELGHVQQYQQRSPLIAARQFLVPGVQIAPQIGYLMIIIGLFLRFSGLIWAGILLFGVMVVFMLLTLPVEIDASRRGLALLQQAGLLQTSDDSGGARAVLTAAAMTYLAAAVSAVLQLLYFISLANRRR
ncbi:MAG: zinc metallopeptidase [Anaerolineae bacterium]|nr:zinc metallopeptidase [Anaerolineae bacterium]NUQ05018.1 zinc metallopeptidase [Anaerolineae bacterium]